MDTHIDMEFDDEIRTQDALLGGISQKLSILKQNAGTIGGMVDVQDKKLDGLNSGTDASIERTRNLTRRVEQVAEIETRNKCCCLIVILIIVLVLLIVFYFM